MQRLTIEVEDCVSGRIERSRGSMSPGEFAARAVAGHMTIDGNGTTARNAQCTTRWQPGWTCSSSR